MGLLINVTIRNRLDFKHVYLRSLNLDTTVPRFLPPASLTLEWISEFPGKKINDADSSLGVSVRIVR